MTEEVARHQFLGAGALASLGKALEHGRGLARAGQVGYHFLREPAQEGRLPGARLNQLHVVGTHDKLQIIRPGVGLDADGQGRGAGRPLLRVHPERAECVPVAVDVHRDLRLGRRRAVTVMGSARRRTILGVGSAIVRVGRGREILEVKLQERLGAAVDVLEECLGRVSGGAVGDFPAFDFGKERRCLGNSGRRGLEITAGWCGKHEERRERAPRGQRASPHMRNSRGTSRSRTMSRTRWRTSNPFAQRTGHAPQSPQGDSGRSSSSSSACAAWRLR